MRSVALVVVAALLAAASSGCLQQDQRFEDPTRLARGLAIAPDDCPGTWHVGLYVVVRGATVSLPEGHNIKMAAGCRPAGEVFADAGVNLSASLVVDGTDHGAYLLAIQFWQSKELVVIENVPDYLRMQPHDGSRVLVIPQGDAATILFVARVFDDFARNQEPDGTPSGGYEPAGQ